MVSLFTLVGPEFVNVLIKPDLAASFRKLVGSYDFKVVKAMEEVRLRDSFRESFARDRHSNQSEDNNFFTTLHIIKVELGSF